MAVIQFDTVVQEGRTEEGRLDNHVLVTNHENRPNFVLCADGSVALDVANIPDLVIDDFGHNAEIVEE